MASLVMGLENETLPHISNQNIKLSTTTRKHQKSAPPKPRQQQSLNFDTSQIDCLSKILKNFTFK